MRALVVTLCLVMIVNILQPHSLLYKPAAAVPISPQGATNATTSCYEEIPEDQLSVQRIEVLRGEILSKLSYTQAPENPPGGLVANEEDLARFSAAVALNEAIVTERREQKTLNCRAERETFYAKEVKLHFPSHFQGELPSVNIFNWDSILSAKRYRRDKDHKEDKDAIDKIDPNVKSETPTTTTTVSYEPISHTPSPPPSAEIKRLISLLTPIQYSVDFNDLHLSTNASIWSATLQLFKRKIVSDDHSLKRTPNPTENVEIYWKSTFTDNDGNRILYPVLIKSQDVRTENDRYVSFDVTEAVRRWRDEGLSSKIQLEVIIRCPESVDTGLLFLPSVQFDVPNSRKNKGSNNANLIIKVLPEKHEETNNGAQTKRQTVTTRKEYCLANPDEETCCLKQTTINFHDDLGFDWIEMPKTFQLTYCKGLCPRVLSSATGNLDFRSQLRAINPTSSPEPCCVPHETRPLTLLVRRETNVELLKLPGMIVDSCQCR